MDQYKKIVLEEPEGQAKYFTKISAGDRDVVKMWLVKQKGTTIRERKFLESVNKAIKEVNYDFWIANIEPSVVEGKIYYAKGQMVGVGFSCNKYKQMAKEYEPERGSRLASIYELFIWYALRIVNGLWTLEYVTDNSSSAGNYLNAPNSVQSIENTGARTCGGYSDGQGNTCKIVMGEKGLAIIGGSCRSNGNNLPVANVNYYHDPSYSRSYSSGVLVLTK